MITTKIKDSFFSQTTGGIDSVIYWAESFLSFLLSSEKPSEMTENIPVDTVQPAQTLHGTPQVPVVAGKWLPTASLRAVWQGVWLRSEQRLLLHQTVIQLSVNGIWGKKEHKQQEVCHFASCARILGTLQEAAAITESSSNLFKVQLSSSAWCCCSSLSHDD